MTDTPRVDNPTGTAEQDRAKTLLIGQEFTYFNRSVSPNRSEIVETADITNTTSDTPFGALIGTARTLDGKDITRDDQQLRVTFMIVSKTETATPSPDTVIEQAIFTKGSPFFKPVMVMDTPQGVFVGLGQSQVKAQERTISFFNWVKVKKDHQITKANVEQLTRKHAAQPRSLKLSELKSSKFIIL